MSHIIAGDGFGHMVHRHPYTREIWTRQSAEAWRRAGVDSDCIRVEDCECEWASNWGWSQL